MEHKLLVLCDPEEDYAQHMADFLRRKKDMDWEVRIFTVQEKLQKFCAVLHSSDQESLSFPLW